MNMKRALATAALALSAVGTAQADQTWAWSYTGEGVAASGTLTTAGPALSFEDILSITGARNGQAITGLVPLGTDPFFEYDNQFSAVGEHFTAPGMLFSLTGHPNVNVYAFEGVYFDLYTDGLSAIEVPITFNVTAVPEPATWLAMLAGLGVVGWQLRRQSASA
jgi:hypothetical protein